MPVLLGLFASICIGISDFLGARTAGRTTALQTTTVAFLGGAVFVALFSPFLGEPSKQAALLGALSGVAAFLALTTLWWGYSRSSVGIVAPMAAVVSAVIPVFYDTIRGDAPGVLGWVGVVVGIGALILTSWSPSRLGAGDNIRDGIVLGALAGVAFAAMFLIAASTAPDAGTWPVVTQRATAFVVAVAVGLAIRQRPMADRVSAGWSLMAGAVGALGVAAVVYGGQRGPVAPVVVSGSMYPAVTIFLAWMLMGQKLRAHQIIGLVAAFVGVALIALD